MGMVGDVKVINLKKENLAAFRYEDGLLLGQRIKSILVNEGKVAINLADTVGMPSHFLNGFLSELIEQYGLDTVKTSVKFINLSPVQAQLIKKYVADYQSLQA